VPAERERRSSWHAMRSRAPPRPRTFVRKPERSRRWFVAEEPKDDTGLEPAPSSGFSSSLSSAGRRQSRVEEGFARKRRAKTAGAADRCTVHSIAGVRLLPDRTRLLVCVPLAGFSARVSAVVARAKPTKTPSAPTSGRYSLLSSPPARGVGVRSEVSALLQVGHVPEPGTQNFAPSKCATRSVACFARNITVAAL
jgi:hypothetical protein